MSGDASVEVATYCRICSPQCGLVATVENGRLASVRGDRNHVLSRGFLCTKPQAMIDITYDPDRIAMPLRRVGPPGAFEPCSWDDALDAIAHSMQVLIDDHGPDSLALLVGNPAAYSVGATLGASRLQRTLGIRSRYSINSDDAASRMKASEILYGKPTMPKPDLWHTQFAMVIGANPLVSHGSRCSEPLFRLALDSIIERGGEVVVVDPRRTATARRYGHVQVRPGSDAWFLIGLLLVMIENDLIDDVFLRRFATGWMTLRDELGRFELEACAELCGVGLEHLEALARRFADAESALVYGATGTCTQQFGTLVNVLQDVVMAATGNIDQRGGWLASWGVIDFAAFVVDHGAPDPPSVSVSHGLPVVVGLLPSAALPQDIRAGGPHRVRGLINQGCNAILTSGAGGGADLADAMKQLDLHVALDLYVNETNRYADYILPVLGMYERLDFPLLQGGQALRPAVWATDPVIEPEGDARDEWWILNELTRRTAPGSGEYPELATAVDAILADSRRPDLTLRTLIEDHPHGLTLRTDLAPGELLGAADDPSGRAMTLGDERVMHELRRLRSAPTANEDYPLRMIGTRDLRSHNSWMHNSPRLMPDDRRFEILLSSTDAARAGVSDGAWVKVTSKSGAIAGPARLTDEIAAGTVVIPHGWGHGGGWSRANRAGGATSNDLVSHDVSDLEPLAAMSVLNGVAVRIEREIRPAGIMTTNS